MALIELLDEGDFIGIIYPDGKYYSIRVALLKKLLYKGEDGCVVLIDVRDRTLELNYLDVEDPLNLGNQYVSLDALWDWFIDTINN